MGEDKLYTESLVVFLDILGLTDTIRETETDQDAIESIADTLNEVQKITRLINSRSKRTWQMDFSVYAFSDSIVISCPEISRKSFILMAHIISAIQIDIMRRQFFLRGAMSAGAHYEKGRVFFGPALVRAYEMEKLSIWPRVIIDPVVLQKLSADTVQTALESYLLRDQNGLCYFNYLHLALALYTSQKEEEPTEGQVTEVDFTKRLRQHKQYLLDAIDRIKAKARFDLLPKYHAVADYHNRYIKDLYQDLPTTENYKEVDPNTATGQIMDIYRAFASSQRGVTENDIESFSHQFTELLYKERDLIQACEIDLSSIFGPLYPHISIS